MSTWDDRPNDYDHACKIIERLREALEVCHEITQDSIYPAWQALQNIAATINQALAKEGEK